MSDKDKRELESDTSRGMEESGPADEQKDSEKNEEVAEAVSETIADGEGKESESEPSVRDHPKDEVESKAAHAPEKEAVAKPAGFEKDVETGSATTERDFRDPEDKVSPRKELEKGDSAAGLEKEETRKVDPAEAVEKTDNEAGLNKEGDEEKADTAESVVESSLEGRSLRQESERSFPTEREEANKPAGFEKEGIKEDIAGADIEGSCDDGSKQCEKEPSIVESYCESSFPSGTEEEKKPAESEKEMQKDDIAKPFIKDPHEEERMQQESEGKTAEGQEDDDVPGAEDQSRKEDTFSDDQMTDEETDEGQLQVVLEFQHLAEAVAFLSFKKTAGELEKATKRLAEAILGPGWLSDKRRRKELPGFVKDKLKKLPQKSPEPILGVTTVQYLLIWLANKSVRWQLIEDEEEQQAVKMCQSIVESVNIITLFDVWQNDFPAPSPENIMLQLNEYKAILMTLGCERAVQIVEDTTGWALEEMEKTEFSRGASKEKDVRIETSVVEMAVVFKAFRHVEEYVYEFCRDSNPKMSQQLAKSLEDKENDKITNFHANLDLIEARAKTSTLRKISELRSCVTNLCQHFVDELKSSRTTMKKTVFYFWKCFQRFKKSLQWDSCRHEQERLYIAKLLHLYVKDGVSEHVEPINVLIPSQLRPVLPRKRHHWIAPNEETFAGRKKELDQICGLLEKQAGTILITGSSGIGKSSLAREVAFRLRTAWPSQFVLDMSTPFSLSASLAEMAAFFTFNDIFQIKQGLRTYDFTVLAMFNDFIQKCDFRILVILENLDSAEAWECLKQTYQEEVAIVMVSREFQTSTARRENLIDLTISLENFSSEEAEECFESLQEDEMSGDLPELKRFMLTLTNNFPVAVHVAGKLFLNFPFGIWKSRILEDFGGLWTQSGRSVVESDGWSLEIASVENTHAVHMLVMFALDLIEKEADLEDLVYRIALLAWPTAPLLPLLFSLGDSASDLDGKVNKLVHLQSFGILFDKDQKEGQCTYTCFGMQPLVSHVILSRMLTLPLDKCFKLFSESVQAMYRILCGADGPEDLNTMVRGSIACSAALLDESGMFERLFEKIASNITLQRRLLAIRGCLLYSLGHFFGSFTEHSSFVVSPERSCKFHARGLAIASHLGEKMSFLEFSEDYLLVIWRSIPGEVLAKMMNQLLVLSITSSKGDGVMVEEDRAGYIAMQFALAAGRVKDFDWAELYFSCSEEVTEDTTNFLTMMEQQIAFYMNESMLDKAEQRLHMYMNKMEKTYGKNVFSHGVCLRCLGQVYLKRGENERAKTYFLESLKVHEPFKEHLEVEKNILECLLYLGSADLLDKSKPNVSRGYLNRALTLAAKLWNKGSEQYSIALSKFAELEDALGNSWKAEEFRQSIPTQFAHFAKPKVSQAESDSSLSSVTTTSASSMSSTSPTKPTKTGKKKKKKKKSKAPVEEKEGNTSQ